MFGFGPCWSMKWRVKIRDRQTLPEETKTITVSISSYFVSPKKRFSLSLSLPKFPELSESGGHWFCGASWSKFEEDVEGGSEEALFSVFASMETQPGSRLLGPCLPSFHQRRWFLFLWRSQIQRLCLLLLFRTWLPRPLQRLGFPLSSKIFYKVFNFHSFLLL